MAQSSTQSQAAPGDYPESHEKVKISLKYRPVFEKVEKRPTEISRFPFKRIKLKKVLVFKGGNTISKKLALKN